MSKVLVVRYDAEELFHVPKWLDLENKTQVKTYYVKWSILHVFLTNDKHIVIKPVNELDFDTKYGDCCDIVDADEHYLGHYLEHDLEDEDAEWEEVDEKEQNMIDTADTKQIAKKIICDIIDKVKAEAEAKAEAANLTRSLN